MKRLLLVLFFLPTCLTQAQSLKWVNDLGAPNYGNYLAHITCDLNNNILATGQFSGTIDFDASSATHNLTGYESAFVAKYDQNNNYKWVTKIFGYGSMYTNSICTDQLGNVIICGEISGITFFTSTDSLVPIGYTGENIFAAKYDANGNFLWAFNLGKDGRYEYGTSINVDNNGNIFLAGSFSDTLDFDPGQSVHKVIAKGLQDTYFAKYDNNGNFLWVHNLGCLNKSNYTHGSTLDNNGNLYITGVFNNTVDFSTNSTPHTLTDSVSNFIAKYDNNGNYIWAFKLGDANNTAVVSSISADATGNLAIAGGFVGTIDFDPSSAVSNLVNPYSWYRNIFVAKYNTNGDYLWAFDVISRNLTILNQENDATAVKLDANGNTYITGGFYSAADFNPGPGSDSLHDKELTATFYLAKYDANGNYKWAFNIDHNSATGSTNYADYGYSLATDANNNVIVSGTFAGTGNDFDPGTNIDTLSPVSGYLQDIFIAKYASDSNKEISESSDLLIFPNPANQRITISSSYGLDLLYIYNTIGQTIYENSLVQTSLNLDVGSLSKGAYLIKVINEKGVFCKKLIID